MDQMKHLRVPAQCNSVACMSGATRKSWPGPGCRYPYLAVHQLSAWSVCASLCVVMSVRSVLVLCIDTIDICHLTVFLRNESARRSRKATYEEP